MIDDTVGPRQAEIVTRDAYEMRSSLGDNFPGNRSARPRPIATLNSDVRETCESRELTYEPSVNG